MKSKSWVISALLASFLVALHLSGFAQTKDQPVPPPTGLQIPDGTVIQAKLRKELDANKVKVGDTLELEVMEDVRGQAPTTVLIPKKAKLSGKVVKLDPKAMAVSIEAQRAEWKGGSAALEALAIEVRIPPQAESAVDSGTKYTEMRDPYGNVIGASRQPATPSMATAAGIAMTPARSVKAAGGLLTLAPGHQIPSDSVLVLLNRSSQRGDAETEFRLGLMYSQGNPMPQDFAKAADCYLEAAEQGLAKAQTNLGVMYALGQGVPRDDVASYMWFTLASPVQPEQSRGNLRLLEARMTKEQIAEAKRRAQEWQKQHPASH